MLTLKPLVSVTTLKPRFSYKIPPPPHHHHHHIHLCNFPLKLRTYAQKESSGGAGNKPVSSNDDVDDGLKKDRFSGFSFRWGDLLNPDPDNFAAVGVAGVLTWASLQVLSQLFFISFAILVAALKYSFIAALLIFILVTLL